MATSIFDKFLTVKDCKYYCNEVAKRLDLDVFDYFYDKYNKVQFPGDSNIYNFEKFRYYEPSRITFILNNMNIIMKTGLDEYVSKKRELIFRLAIKGYQFMYTCKFTDKNHNETDNDKAVQKEVNEMKLNHLEHVCLNCHGSGWYNPVRKWGCFRCGGLQYPSKQGTGIDPLSKALCILENVYPEWIDKKESIDKAVAYTGWTRERTVKTLNWMWKEGLLVVHDDKAIDVAVYNSLRPDDEGVC